MITKVEFHARKIALISAYAPNTFDSAFYNTLITEMLELTDYPFIVGADFNAVWDPVVDRSNATASREQGQATNALKSWADSLGLKDIWRTVNPSSKDFTFFSGRHQSFSRIYFLFASPQLFRSTIRQCYFQLLYLTIKASFAPPYWAVYPSVQLDGVLIHLY